MDTILDQKIDALLEGMPHQVSARAHAQVAFLKGKRPAISNVEIYEQMEEYINLLRLAFMDRRSYLSAPNRFFAEGAMHDAIERLMKRPEPEYGDADFYSLGRVHFDLAGLQALNILSGREAGSRALKTFFDILAAGDTTKWLTSQGIEVIASAEGVDQFGLTLIADRDLRELVPSIAEKYFAEIRAVPVAQLLNFAHPFAREELEKISLADKVPSNTQFELAAGLGIVLFGEAVSFVAVEESQADYRTLVSRIINKMFAMADTRARAQFSAFVEELARKNPALHSVFTEVSLREAARTSRVTVS